MTTKNYQAVAYAVRGPDDGYDDYSYKHLTLLNKHNGKVLAEYSAGEITITEEEGSAFYEYSVTGWLTRWWTRWWRSTIS